MKSLAGPGRAGPGRARQGKAGQGWSCGSPQKPTNFTRENRMDIDKARELSDNAAIDELGNGPEFWIQGREEGFRYDAKTWQEDCGDYLIGDEASSDYLRKQLIQAFVHLDDYQPSTERGKMLRAQCINMVLTNIGQQIIENVIAAGITRNKLGDM